MKRLIDIFKKAFAAGIMIGIGGTIFVASDNRIIGAVLFSVGLLSVCFFGTVVILIRAS